MANQKNYAKSLRIILVDGSSYLYRAYHALPNLRGPGNVASGALYGIISMLKKIRRDYPSDYGVCVFDAQGKTFRNSIYPSYKSNRPKMPEDLALQIPSIHRAVIALGWPMLMIQGVEADDVIGTLTQYALQEELEVVISTGDKDMTQLVNEHVVVVNTMNNEFLDQTGVFNKFGVHPEQIVDYLSLIGDAVDNVPGVQKVGPKTASKWLGIYHSLERIIASAGDIQGVVGKNLRSALDWLPQAKKILTIKCDCKLPENFIRNNSILDNASSLKFSELNKKEMLGLCKTYGFKTWIRELESDREKNTTTDQDAISQQRVIYSNYELITDWFSFDSWLEKIYSSSITSFDLETTSRNPIEARIVGFSFSIFSGQACYIPVGHQCLKEVEFQLPIDDVIDRLQKWMENPTQLKLGQNLKYDRQVLLNYQISLEGIAHDTLLQSYILESHHRHDLGRLAKRHLNLETISYESLCGKGVNQICFDQVPLNDACRYAAEDADVALRLHHVLYPKIIGCKSLKKIYENIEIPLIPVLTNMERTGVKIDVSLLSAQSAAIEARLRLLEEEASQLTGVFFNLNSPKQIGDILFNKSLLPIIKKTPSGAPSTDDEVLQKLAVSYSLPKLILDYRSLSKLKTTYTDKLPRMLNKDSGRVHTSYGQTVAVTGRLVSTEPNLQNIPIRTSEGRRIREAFVAKHNYKILSADYSQIELRIMAHLSQDEGLIAAFKKGEDVHVSTASEIFSIPCSEVTIDQRRLAKTINFGLIYGMGAFGLANSLNITREKAKKYIERYFERYPKIAIFMEKIRHQAKVDGFVETVLGRRLWLPDINGGGTSRRQAAERAAINAPMQGTVADMIKLSMIATDCWLKKSGCSSKMIMQVHDELVFEAAEDEIDLLKEELPKLMCQIIDLEVPLQVDIGVGDNWDQAH